MAFEYSEQRGAAMSGAGGGSSASTKGLGSPTLTPLSGGARQSLDDGGSGVVVLPAAGGSGAGVAVNHSAATASATFLDGVVAARHEAAAAAVMRPVVGVRIPRDFQMLQGATHMQRSVSDGAAHYIPAEPHGAPAATATGDAASTAASNGHGAGAHNNSAAAAAAAGGGAPLFALPPSNAAGFHAGGSAAGAVVAAASASLVLSHPALATSKSGPAAGSGDVTSEMDAGTRSPAALAAPPPSRQVSAQPGSSAAAAGDAAAHGSGVPADADTSSRLIFAFGGPRAMGFASSVAEAHAAHAAHAAAYGHPHLTADQMQRLTAAEMALAHGHVHAAHGLGGAGSAHSHGTGAGTGAGGHFHGNSLGHSGAGLPAAGQLSPQRRQSPGFGPAASPARQIAALPLMAQRDTASLAGAGLSAATLSLGGGAAASHSPRLSAPAAVPLQHSIKRLTAPAVLPGAPGSSLLAALNGGGSAGSNGVAGTSPTLRPSAAAIAAGAAPGAPALNTSVGAANSNVSPYPTPRSKSFSTIAHEVGPYRRIRISEIESANDPELKQVCTDLRTAMQLRRRYVWTPRRAMPAAAGAALAPTAENGDAKDAKAAASQHSLFPPAPPVFTLPSGELVGTACATPSPYKFAMVDGVMRVFHRDTPLPPPAHPPAAPATPLKPGAADAKAAAAAGSAPARPAPLPMSPSTPISAPAAPHYPESLFTAPTVEEFFRDLSWLMNLTVNGPTKTLAHNRLHINEARFNLHGLLNHEIEAKAQKQVPHRDFYNVRKIDNHVHHSACMNQKHLLRFIKHKLKTNPHEPVIVRNDKVLTLDQVFESLNLRAYDLSIDTLDMHADKTFHRFDKFNLKYNPVGESRLREIFLKYDNMLKGRYLAQITRQVFDDLEANKYQFAEYRVSIYGRSASEWDALAAWVVDHKLFSPNVRWMIQIPRLYSVYKANNIIRNLQDMLDNIFRALFEVTIDPNTHPKLHQFLQQCVGFDSVDDESIREPSLKRYPKPLDWCGDTNPPYSMFGYYLYANLLVLNKLRESKGLSTFAYRPHAGEAGDIEHLACTYLIANSINHGLMLKEAPVLQYLYYLSQVGVSMSPLSNNLLFVEYDRNPFPRYFARGLNVALSTDDPLMIHVTKEPLVEEYSVAAQVWKLSPVDVCEIARYSVLQSGFEPQFKAHWIGANYRARAVQGNDINQTNVPNIRMEFRLDLLTEALAFIAHSAGPTGLDLCDPLY